MEISVKQISNSVMIPVRIESDIDDHYDVMPPDDLLPRGDGDPDFYGYPGEER